MSSLRQSSDEGSYCKGVSVAQRAASGNLHRQPQCTFVRLLQVTTLMLRHAVGSAGVMAGIRSTEDSF